MSTPVPVPTPTPTRIIPFYETSKVSPLKDEHAILKLDGVETNGKIRLIQTWSPMSVWWEFTPDATTVFKHSEVEFTSPSIKGKGRIQSFNQTSAVGYLVGQAEIGTDYKIDRATFHLANYPDLNCHPPIEEVITNNGTATTIVWSEVKLEAEGWTIRLQPYRNYAQLRRQTIEDNTPLLSGVGEIRKSDGSEFKKKELLPLLDALRFFLSFAFARWTAPLLVVGANTVSSNASQYWASYEISEWTYLLGWLDERHGSYLSKSFPGFMKVWADEDIQESLKIAITWLVEATRQSGGLDGAIAFSQIPLEMLAWLVLVQKDGILDFDEFEGLSAAAKMQLLFSTCKIPLDVPAELPSLIKLRDKLAAKKKWTATQLIVKLRNAIIHPHKKNRESLREWETDDIKLVDIRWESFRLFKWYLTLVLLHITGYNGKYANHLTHRTIGQVEDVPWAK